MNKYVRDVLTFPSDARRAWRADGKRGVWEEVAERTVYRLGRVAEYDLFERELASIRPPNAPSGVTVRMLEAHEFPLLYPGMTCRRRTQFEGSDAQRLVCAAFREGEVVGYSWWTTALDSELTFAPLVLPNDAVFHGFVHVERSERSQGTASAIFGTGEASLRAQGARLCWFLVSTSNVPGLRSTRGKWGARARHVARLGYSKSLRGSKRFVQVMEGSVA